MNILSRLGLGAKIGIITLIAIVSFLATLSVNITATNINAKNLKHIESNLYPLSNLSGQNAILIQRIEEQYTQAVSTGEEDLLIKASATLDILRNNLEQVTELDVESSGDSNELTDNLDKYQQLNQKIATAMITGDVDFKVIGEMAKQKSVIYQDLLQKIQNYRTNVDLRFETVMNTAVERSQNTIVLTLTVGGSLLMLMLITAWLVTRSIVQTVNNAATSLNALARGEGDLNYQLPIETEDAFGRMSKNFNCFMQLLKSSISEVLLVADPLSSNASTLEDRMHQVSRDMQSQSNTAETLQESMSELQQSVSTTSQSAIAAANAAGDAEREIQRGLSVVDQTTQTSNELNDEISRASEVVHQLATDTQSVNSILDVITTIAEQTNLLALNAAIESARAGAYGRGFAVVADEVRTLASKTSEATTRIRDLVNSLGDAAELSENSMQLATKKSENNLEHARAAGDVLRALQEDIQNINQRNAQIATTTEQQNSMASNASENAAKMYSSLDQMQSGIQEVDSITIELSQFAENLRSTTGKFQL